MQRVCYKSLEPPAALPPWRFDSHTVGEPLILKFVSFQNVSHLTLFLVGNLEDGEVTEVQRVRVVGQPLSTTNMSELKKGG